MTFSSGCISCTSFDWARGPKDTLNALGGGILSESCGEICHAAGTLPFATLRVAGGRGVRPTHKLIQSRLFFQVDMLDVLNGQAQEPLSEAAEFFGGVGGEELQARC